MIKQLLLAGFLLGLIVGFTSCSHSQLKRCPQPAPENVYHCDKQVEGDFRMCRKDSQAFQCVEPQ